jgi:hypothetical protein
MAGTASGTTTFVLGQEADGNRETRTFLNGEAYDLDFEDVKAYTVGTTKFPYVAD